MSLTIVNKEEHELIKKIAKRTKGYTEQIKMCNKTIKEQDEKIDTIYKYLMQSVDTCNEKEDSRRILASRVGGLTTSLNTQKEKNVVLVALNNQLINKIEILELELKIKDQEMKILTTKGKTKREDIQKLSDLRNKLEKESGVLIEKHGQ